MGVVRVQRRSASPHALVRPTIKRLRSLNLRPLGFGTSEGSVSAANEEVVWACPTTFRTAIAASYETSPRAFSSDGFGWAPIAAAAGSPPLKRIMVGIDWTP